MSIDEPAEADFTQLDDPAFLSERARVRMQLEDPAAPAELAARYEALNDEFLRRARRAWAQPS